MAALVNKIVLKSALKTAENNPQEREPPPNPLPKSYHMAEGKTLPQNDPRKPIRKAPNDGNRKTHRMNFVDSSTKTKIRTSPTGTKWTQNLPLGWPLAKTMEEAKAKLTQAPTPV
jgi:hypothetical protein